MSRLAAMPRLLRSLLREETDAAAVQLLRYALVGGVAFVADLGALALLTEVGGLHYLVSGALAFLLWLTVNYLLSVRWVFRSRSLDSRSAEFGVYGAIGVAGLALNELVLWLLTGVLARHYLVSKVVATGFVFFWNFWVRRYLLFTTRPELPPRGGGLAHPPSRSPSPAPFPHGETRESGRAPARPRPW